MLVRGGGCRSEGWISNQKENETVNPSQSKGMNQVVAFVICDAES